MKRQRGISLGLAMVFAAAGAAFLLIPDGVLGLFNRLSAPWGLPASPLVGSGLWLALAGAYMYLVTWLAVAMALWPTDRRWPLALANGKLGSSLLSLVFFLQHHYLVLAVNFVVDLSLGLFVLWLRRGREP